MCTFEWDNEKNEDNQTKHGVSFEKAQYVFDDPNRIITIDTKHSTRETRYYCIGKIDDRICTVRYTTRGTIIKIFGAGYWRKEQKIYENKNKKI